MNIKNALLALTLAVTGAALAAPIEISNVPLLNIKGTGAVKPNLVLLYDDSGSMGFDYLPDIIARLPSGGSSQNCRASAKLSTARRVCDNGDAPFSSPDWNKVYYNPDNRYTPPVDAAGTPFVLANYGIKAGYTAVWNDGFCAGCGTTNLVTGFGDLKWCDPNDTTSCFKNSTDYRYPDETYNVATSSPGAPYYYRIRSTEYCTDATLTSCINIKPGGTAPVGYPVAAMVRYCTDTTLASNTCQAKVDATHLVPRFSTDAADRPAYSILSIGASSTTTAMKVDWIKVTESSGTVTITNGVVNAAAGAASDATRKALAADLAKSIIAKTGLTNQYTACIKTAVAGVPACSAQGFELKTEYDVGIIALDCAAGAPSKASCPYVKDASRLGWTVSSSSTIIRPATALLKIAGTSQSVLKIASLKYDGVELLGSGLTFSSGNKSNTTVVSGLKTKIGTQGTLTAYIGGDAVTPTCDGVGTDYLCLVNSASSENGLMITVGTITKQGSLAFTPTNSKNGDGITIETRPFVQGGQTFVRVNIVPKDPITGLDNTFPRDADRSDCASSSFCTYDEEMQNFAIWYTFYRVRNPLMKTAVGQAFASLNSSYRIGLSRMGTAAGGGALTIKPVVFSDDPLVTAVAGGGTPPKNRTLFYNALYGITVGSATPMREALHNTALNFQDPAVVTELCQPNFILVATDGIWNGSSVSEVADNDNVANAARFCTKAMGCVDPNGTLFKNEKTLADIALYWYNGGSATSTVSLMDYTGTTMVEDMSKEGIVPGTTLDNKHLHINTYTLGLGLDGFMTYDKDYDQPGKITDLTRIQNEATGCPWNGGGKYVWPNTNSSGTENQARVDDLWHTAVNGHGKYFSASVPKELVHSLTSALNNMNSVGGAASAAATSTPNISVEDRDIFSDTYTTVKWYGELSAQTIDTYDGTVSTTPTWITSATLGQKAIAKTRKILMQDVASSGGTLKNFDYGDMNAQEKAWFDSKCSILAQCTDMDTAQRAIANDGAKLVGWLRGDQDNANNTVFRAYSQIDKYPGIPIVLGDIASSKPAYLREPRKSYQMTGYAAYKLAQTKPTSGAREPVVFTAANDGMLHAFNATTGDELWGYVPRITMAKLPIQASTNYGTNHQFTTDGSPELGDVQIGGVWKTVLVAPLGAGGRGYYALDVTDPTKPKSLWEICADKVVCAKTATDSRFGNIGLTFGNVQFGMWKNKWVVFLTSGYNNIANVDNVPVGDGGNYLYVIDVATGDIVDVSEVGSKDTTTPAGLAKITSISLNPAVDPVTTYVYGGDNQGNMWRWDLTSKLSIDTVKMASAGASQPVTTRPEVSTCEVTPGNVKRVVVYGTGRLLSVTDTKDTAMQSLYVLKDLDGKLGNPITAIRGSTMVKQKFTRIGATGSYTVSALGVDLATKDGWFVDWDLNSKERNNLDPKVLNGAVNVVTNVPGESSACSVGGSSNVYQLGVCTGTTKKLNDVAGTVLSANSAAVGFIIVRLPSGKLKMITTLADGKKQTSEVKPFDSRGARKVGWRRVSN